MRALSYAVSSIAGLVAVGAGIYLLTRQSASGDTCSSRRRRDDKLIQRTRPS